MKNLMISMISMIAVGCVPRIEVAPPKEPVTIKMHIKVDHEIHITMDDQVKTLLQQNSNLLTESQNEAALPSSGENPPEKK